MAQVGNLIALPTFGEHGAVNVVVESPRGATLKLTFDPDLGVMTLSRPLPQGLVYPHDWGFIPSTRAEDGDPLDAIVVWDGVSYPGVVIACRPIGVLQIEQNNKETGERERNDRLAVLPVDAPRWNSIGTIDDLGERACLELEHFFRAAVAFEGKELRTVGWKGPAAAMKLVRASIRTTRGKRR
ncbi:MAG TPA: inorganic diphosphatase [Vicinamibacterales bacterium]|nr:inorganic diphosphatase [Vicinamibacterales bacterium]